MMSEMAMGSSQWGHKGPSAEAPGEQVAFGAAAFTEVAGVALG